MLLTRKNRRFGVGRGAALSRVEADAEPVEFAKPSVPLAVAAELPRRRTVTVSYGSGFLSPDVTVPSAKRWLKTRRVGGSPLRGPSRARYRIQQLPGVVRCRRVQDLIGFAGFDGNAVVHDDALVADLSHYAKVV